MNEHAVMLCNFCYLAQGGSGVLVLQAHGQGTYSLRSWQDFSRRHFAVYLSGEAAIRMGSSQVEIPAKIFVKFSLGG